MKTSPEGRKKIKEHEGEVLTAYQDQVGVWTIGVGHTASAGLPAPVKGMKITKEESDEILSRDLALFEKVVNDVVKVSLNQNQFDALVSLTLNIGGGAFSKSTLVRKLNAGDYQGAAEQFLVWNKAGGKVNKGLVNRRAKEKALFEKPVASTKPSDRDEVSHAPQEGLKAPPAAVSVPQATEVAPKRPSLLGTLLIVLWNKLTGKR